MLQHTPSAQLPFTHWFEAPQARPSAFFGTQAPPASHQSPEMQSASDPQLVKQEVGPQTYGLHCVVDPEGQVPVPLQFAGGMAVPALQLAARQAVAPPG